VCKAPSALEVSRRAAPGSILPEQAYWRPILAIIDEAGGSMAATDVIEAVWDRLHDQFRPRDLERQRLGEMRWRNRVRFARLRMKERGLLSDSSPRGVWEITEEGRRYLARTQ
jgi:restriction endonuclease Mrr